MDVCLLHKAADSVVPALLPVGAFVAAVHVDVAEHRLPAAWTRAAGAACVVGVLVAAICGLELRLVSRLGGAVALPGLLWTAGRVSHRRGRKSSAGIGVGDLRFAAVMGLALGMNDAAAALALASLAVLLWALRSGLTCGRRISFGPALLFGHVLVLGFLLAAPVEAQESEGLAQLRTEDRPIPELEFRNEPVASILTVLGHSAGATVLADRTVTGNASFYTPARSFGEALSLLAEAQDLFIEKREDSFYASRIRVRRHAEGALTVQARDVDADLLMARLDQATPVSVVQRGLSGRTISLHVVNAELSQVLSAVADHTAGLRVQETSAGYLLAAARDVTRDAASTGASVTVKRREGGYELHSDGVSLSRMLRELMRAAGPSLRGHDYINLSRAGAQVPQLRLSAVSFDEALRAVAEAAGTRVRKEGDRWIFGAERRTRVRVGLQHVRVSQVLETMPRELAAGIDLVPIAGTNTLQLSGPPDSLDAAVRYISGLDRLPEGFRYHRFDLSFVSATEALRSLPSQLHHEAAVVLDAANVLLIPATESQRDRIALFFRRVDVAPDTVSLRLRHLAGQRFLASLPPAIPRRYLTQTDDPQLLLFSGPRAVEERVRELMAVLDRERRQVRYDLLIIQYQEGQSVDYRLGIESTTLRPFDTPVVLGRIGELLSISADIISLFGHRFAVTLSSALSNNDARVLADTSVTALSGTPVSFRNTETYRYRDLPAANSEEAEEIGVTREITSGLFIDIDGTVRDQRTVSLSIEARVSKRGRDVGDAGTNPPATAERVVSTALRAESGRPIVVGRFLISDESRSLRRVPILGQIPVLGWLFRGVQSSREESELVVYLVPHVLTPPRERSERDLLDAMHRARQEVLE